MLRPDLYFAFLGTVNFSNPRAIFDPSLLLLVEDEVFDGRVIVTLLPVTSTTASARHRVSKLLLRQGIVYYGGRACGGVPGAV
jgi:hypothetical protein